MAHDERLLILTARVRRFHPYVDELQNEGYSVEVPRYPADLAEELLRSADRWDGVIVDTELPADPVFNDPSWLPHEPLRDLTRGIRFYQRLRAAHPAKCLWLWASSRAVGTQYKHMDSTVTMIHGYRALPAELVTYMDGYFDYTVHPYRARPHAG